MHIAIRVDASLQMGTGHTYRCLTLANALVAQGHSVVFFVRRLMGHLSDMLSKQHQVVELPAPEQVVMGTKHCLHANWLEVDYELEIDQMSEACQRYLHEHNLKAFDWLIADHYAIDRQWHQAMRTYSQRIMQIDDLADRLHDCDLLLDQNAYLHAERRYQNLVPAHCQQLLGGQFALLRPEFQQLRHQLPEYSQRLAHGRVVVFFGGVDQHNETCKALKGMLAVSSRDHFDVVIGQHNPHRAELERLTQLHTERMTLHIQTPRLGQLMAQAYLYVGAVGATTWERCVLGLPGLVCSVALNQEQLSKDLKEQNVLFYLGKNDELTEERYRETYQFLLQNEQVLQAQSQIALGLSDGFGVYKMINYLA